MPTSKRMVQTDSTEHAAASSGRRHSPETRTTSDKTKFELEGLQYIGSELVVAIVDLQARLHGRPVMFFSVGYSDWAGDAWRDCKETPNKQGVLLRPPLKNNCRRRVKVDWPNPKLHSLRSAVLCIPRILKQQDEGASSLPASRPGEAACLRRQQKKAVCGLAQLLPPEPPQMGKGPKPGFFNPQLKSNYVRYPHENGNPNHAQADTLFAWWMGVAAVGCRLPEPKPFGRRFGPKLHCHDMQIAPSHVKRDYNMWADELTHPTFTVFISDLRLPVEPILLHFTLVKSILDERLLDHAVSCPHPWARAGRPVRLWLLPDLAFCWTAQMFFLRSCFWGGPGLQVHKALMARTPKPGNRWPVLRAQRQAGWLRGRQRPSSALLGPSREG